MDGEEWHPRVLWYVSQSLARYRTYMESEMQSEQGASRVLPPSERALAIVVGVSMLCLSALSLVVTISLFMPLVRLVEGLSK